jgi:hypothetical protein
VVGCCECGDEPYGCGTTDLVSVPYFGNSSFMYVRFQVLGGEYDVQSCGVGFKSQLKIF